MIPGTDVFPASAADFGDSFDPFRVEEQGLNPQQVAIRMEGEQKQQQYSGSSNFSTGSSTNSTNFSILDERNCLDLNLLVKCVKEEAPAAINYSAMKKFKGIFRSCFP